MTTARMGGRNETNEETTTPPVELIKSVMVLVAGMLFLKLANNNKTDLYHFRRKHANISRKVIPKKRDTKRVLTINAESS